jgi:hypothetical protein
MAFGSFLRFEQKGEEIPQIKEEKLLFFG